MDSWLALDRFKYLNVVDFEFIAPEGSNPWPVCVVVHELRSGQKTRLWHNEFGLIPPYETGPDSLFIAYQASAEASCHIVLGWPRPCNILDLYAEYRWLENGKYALPQPSPLLQALIRFGIEGITADEKQSKRALVLRGDPWSRQERLEILNYCEGDVEVTAQLLLKMLPLIDLSGALLRGRFMYAIAWVEHVGVPFDAELRTRAKAQLPALKANLICDVDREFGVYVNGSFNVAKFIEYINRNGIAWPSTKKGNIRLDEETWEERSDAYPQLRPLRYLREFLTKQRLLDFPSGPDGRNRTYMNPFWTVTGRNQPSPAKFILGAPSWLRGLAKPARGEVLAILDWHAQEFGIAAYLSGDQNMIRAYLAEDIYLWFAETIGAAPQGATVETHKELRDRFKTIVLALQFEIGREAFAARLGCTGHEATSFMRLHHEIFPDYWKWLDDVKNHSFIHTRQYGTFGWRRRITEVNDNARSVGNFFSQSNGAEMMRLGAIYATESGLPVCGLMHDAFALVSPEERIEVDVAAMRGFMERASGLVLNGPKLKVSKPTLVRWPDRYLKEKGLAIWQKTLGRI